DAAGTVLLRADDFNTSGTSAVSGENILRVDLTARSNSLNAIFSAGGTNAVSDAASTMFVLNADTVTLNTPGAIPNPTPGNATAVVFDFAGEYRPNGGPAEPHIDSGVEAHRGNPSFSVATPLGGVGTVASIARFAARPVAI